MDERQAEAEREQQFWYEFLTRGDSMERRARRVLRMLPHGPRCQLCAAPFAGATAPLMRAIGRRPADKNPRVCQACFTFIARHHGGAEIEATFLFADIRGSTTLAEGMSTAEFHALLDRFYAVSSNAVFEHDGSVDKFVGDEIVAMFFPVMSGPAHARKAVAAAQALLRSTGHADPGGPWVPVGAGVHSGLAWVGAVGDDAHTEITALGDSVNTTARLASAAAAGEVLVTTAAARLAGLEPGHETRALALKGKDAPTEVLSLRVGASGPCMTPVGTRPWVAPATPMCDASERNGPRRRSTANRRQRMTKQVVIGVFADEGLADSAAAVLKEWDQLEPDIKLNSIGVLAADEFGKLKTEKVGRRTIGKGAGVGLALAMLTPVGLAAGVIGGGVLGALHRKGLGIKPEVRDKLGWDLSGGKAAVGVLVDVQQADAVRAKLTELGGTVQSYEMSDEQLDEMADAAGTFELGQEGGDAGKERRRMAPPT